MFGWVDNECKQNFDAETCWETSTLMTVKDNIKTDIRVISCGDRRCMKLAQDRVHGWLFVLVGSNFGLCNNSVS
jgi:hypothetical protein